MPTPTRETLLSRYHYDPLDRLVNCTTFKQSAIHRYYCKTRLVTEIQGSVQRSIVQHEEQLLAQQQREGGKAVATLLATDLQRSVLNALDANQPHPLAYTPYGHRPIQNGLLSLLGFNGERPDPVTGHYHLGEGYRQFNPVLMRFNSPDSRSPFGKGGVNSYAYCSGDPINRVDPNGRAWKKFLKLMNFNIAKNTTRSGASQHTLDAIDNITKLAGGKEKLAKTAKAIGMKKDEYLIHRLRQETLPNPYNQPDLKKIPSIGPSQLENEITLTQTNIADLDRMIAIRRDLADAYSPGLDDGFFKQLEKAHSKNYEYLERLIEKRLPAYEPPPSYEVASAMKNIRG